MLSFRQYIREVDLSFDRKHPKLSSLETKLRSKLDSDEEEELKKYTKISSVLNNPLIQYHNNGIVPPNNMPTSMGLFNLPALDSATNKPFNRSFTMYSGLGFDPRTQSKNNKLLLPAFTSCSLNKGTAGKYMRHTDEHGFQHIIRVNVKYNDKGVSNSSFTDKAHEIILPRNTILHIHRSEIDPEKPNVMVHHATIDHESNPHDFQKPMKTQLVNDLMDKIQTNTHTNYDLNRAHTDGYLNQDHIDELSKQLLQKIKTRTYEDKDLDHAVKYGYITNIGQNAINAIANNPKSPGAHEYLAQAHKNGKHIGQKAIDAIANNPDSTKAHNILVDAHYDGRSIGQNAIGAIANNPRSTNAHEKLAHSYYNGENIGQDAIDAIANNPNPTKAHDHLALAYMKGRDIGQKAINAIANQPNSTNAHASLAQAHQDGKDIGKTAIDAIANNPDSILAHKWLAIAHHEFHKKNQERAEQAMTQGISPIVIDNTNTQAYEGREIGQKAIDVIANHPKSTDAHAALANAHHEGISIGQDAIDAIANNPESTKAHEYLAKAHNNGKEIGQKAIDAIANQPKSTDAHEWLAQAHYDGRDIKQHAIEAIANNPESIDAHNFLVRAHNKGRSVGEANYNKILSYGN